jgi:divinyl protochlorophyllide a 8-vinyl-reductase
VTRPAPGGIGPNAIIQTAAALETHLGAPRASRLIADATGRPVGAMPTGMVDEREVNRLVHALRETLDPALVEAVLHDAGVRTAAYLIEHRIPRLAVVLMRCLPNALALRLLLAGIMRHTWTFAGTASVRIVRGATPRLVIAGCPMCRGITANAPACHFYAATLATLLARTISPRADVIEVRCEALGDHACEFAMRLP